jgi:pimeloyl-ACP methyl ester carboxylesterase
METTDYTTEEPRKRGLPGHKPGLGGLIRIALLAIITVFLLLHCHRDKKLDVLRAAYAFPDSRYMDLDGMPVHYRDVGKGEAILLLHDSNNSLHTWDGWIDSLSATYRTIAVDLPGFGLTGPHPRGSYSTFMYVEFISRFADSLGLKSFHLIGNGLGAQIAWVFASEQGTKLKSLVLIDAPGFEQNSNSGVAYLARIPFVNRLIWSITPRAALCQMLEDMYANDSLVTDSLVDRHFDLFLRAGNRKAFTDQVQVRDNRPPVKVVEQINVPCLVVWGAEDIRISPEYAYEFHRLIKGSALKIYRNAGHWPQQEIPEKSVGDILNFLKGRF